jgi:hypothetical protein
MEIKTVDETTDETKEMTELEYEHYETIKERNAEVARLLLEWTQLKGDASEAKKEYDQAVSELSYLISRGPEKQQKLPFVDSTDGESLAWRDIMVEESLGLTAKILEKLEDAGVRTIGELEDLRAGAGLTSIGGIGQTTADKIEEQVLEWLSENRDKFGETVEESTEQDEIDGDTEGDSDDDI